MHVSFTVQTYTHTHLDLFGVSTCTSGRTKPKMGDTVRDIFKSLRPVAPIWVQGDICPGAQVLLIYPSFSTVTYRSAIDLSPSPLKLIMMFYK